MVVVVPYRQMADRLTGLDPEELLKESRKIAVEEDLVPTDCPKPKCLYLHQINLNLGNDNDETKVILNSNPPRLPTTNPILLYETPDACRRCTIDGNDNRTIEIRVKDSGSISAKGEWRESF